MSKKKLQDKKAKAKERATEAQKRQARLFADRRKRYDRQLEKEAKANRDRPAPIKNKSHLDKIQEHLDNNLEVLRALEQEYIQSQLAREDLQESLEAEGYSSLDEKMEDLRNRSIKLAEEAQDQIIEQERFKHEAKVTAQNKTARAAKKKLKG